MWYLPPPTPNNPPHNYLADSTVEVTIPISISGRACSVGPQNEIAWTEKERAIASQAPHMRSVEELVSLGLQTGLNMSQPQFF